MIFFVKQKAFLTRNAFQRVNSDSVNSFQTQNSKEDVAKLGCYMIRINNLFSNLKKNG
jgi:hypothetical protein